MMMVVTSMIDHGDDGDDDDEEDWVKAQEKRSSRHKEAPVQHGRGSWRCAVQPRARRPEVCDPERLRLLGQPGKMIGDFFRSWQTPEEGASEEVEKEKGLDEAIAHVEKRLTTAQKCKETAMTLRKNLAGSRFEAAATTHVTRMMAGVFKWATIRSRLRQRKGEQEDEERRRKREEKQQQKQRRQPQQPPAKKAKTRQSNVSNGYYTTNRRSTALCPDWQTGTCRTPLGQTCPQGTHQCSACLDSKHGAFYPADCKGNTTEKPINRGRGSKGKGKGKGKKPY